MIGTGRVLFPTADNIEKDSGNLKIQKSSYQYIPAMQKPQTLKTRTNHMLQPLHPLSIGQQTMPTAGKEPLRM